jgi:tetratricopeptide (TPR) repeat protein
MAKVKKSSGLLQQQDGGMQIIFWLLFPLILIPPFNRGLFFDEELLIAHMYTAVVAGLYFFLRKDRLTLSRSIMDYAGPGLILAYFISTFVALSLRDAVGEVLKVTNYVLLYWLIAYVSKDIKDLQKIIAGFFVAGLGVALAGLGTAYGTFNFNGAFVGGLINSTLQYHNAVAIYLVACGLLGFYLAVAVENLWVRLAVAGGTFIIVTTAFGAGSRGAILVTPIVYFGLLLLMPREYKEKLLYNMLAVFVPFALTAKQTINFGLHDANYYWGVLTLGALLSAGMQYGFERFLRFDAGLRRKYSLIAGSLVIAAVTVFIAVGGEKVMPTAVAVRVKSINLADASVQERYYFYGDAIKLFKDYPVTGAGGGGWTSAYRKYQSFLYHTTEVHSHPIQVLVETGVIGFTFFMLLWIGLLVTFIRIMRDKNVSVQLKAVTVTGFFTALAMGLHSAIDFTLSLGAAMLLMWAQFGIVRAAERVGIEEVQGRGAGTVLTPVWRKALGIPLAAAFLLAAVSLNTGIAKAKAAMYDFQAGYAASGLEKLESASKYDPFNYTYPMQLSQIHNQMAFSQNNYNSVLMAVAKAEEAVRKNKGEADVQLNLANAYLVNRQTEQALAAAWRVLELSPFRQEAYEMLLQIHLSAAKLTLEAGNKERAREILRQALTIPDLINQQVAGLNEFETSAFKGNMLNVSENMKNGLAEAESLLNQ